MINFSFTDGFAHVIDGKKATSPTTKGVVDPATEDVFAHVPVATQEQLEDAVLAAERAFPGWRNTPWGERQQVLEDTAGLLERHTTEFVELLMREAGKDRMSAGLEMSLAVPWLRAAAKGTLEDEIVQDDEHRIVKNRFRPYGVVAGITPFNFPVVLTITKMGQALLAGNCIIIKAPPTCPCSVLKFIELAQAVVPRGVLSVLYGGNDLGESIVRHPRILRVSMTGSIGAGKAIMRAAADGLKNLTLELGGNDPAIVLDDVDPKAVAQRIILGATCNAGQTCFCMKRIYVHANVYAAVRDELVALAHTMKVGNPFDSAVSIGPVQNRAQHERLSGLISDCKKRGYKIAFESETPAGGKGFYVPLVIVDNAPDESRIVREEQFGPIIPLMRWTDDEDVVRRANNSEYGLGSSIWGRDVARLQKIADKLESGMVWINEWGVVGGDYPMGGTKHSGIGYENAKYGLASWTYVQSYVCNKKV